MRRLFEYAMALETEVREAERDLRAALVEAVHAAEGRVAAQYQAALAEAAAEVEEEQALERSMAEQLAELEAALGAARQAQRAWRDRALQAERQFDQLKQMIGRRLQQAADAARRTASEQQQEQAISQSAGELRREHLAAEAQQEGAHNVHSRGPAGQGAEHGRTAEAGQSAEEDGQGGAGRERRVPPLNAIMKALEDER
ncbi:hypothetical protein COHA_009553 [Chlorella ohadii]|nr:hypothetical protein COHA_009553 [Chlorella ohadii]